MTFKGMWHIYEMELWDEDYFNMEVQAYIKIGSNNIGDFQFGLVSGELGGRIVRYPDGPRFEFTFEAYDENDPASGRGWMKEKEKDVVEGEFWFHLGDCSTFLARRALLNPER
jgi:hypothetical protein